MYNCNFKIRISGILKVAMNGDSQQLLVNMKDESIRLNNRQTRFLNDLDISKSGGLTPHTIIALHLLSLPFVKT